LDPPPALAVVSQSAKTLTRLGDEFEHTGTPVTRIWSTDDRDQYLSRPELAGDRVVLGSFDAVRGLEFDTVIVADLSQELVPNGGVEPWRNAARLYSTLTRARDELVMTSIGRPSGFVSMMDEYVESIGTPGYDQIALVLAALKPKVDPGH
jgi:superfamily I DNA/RNA helicase